LPHWREAIDYAEAASNLYEAGQTRYNVALALARAGRLQDAREYAQVALRNFQTGAATTWGGKGVAEPN